ncbi:MAG: hypothetical protein HN732_09255 [Rhodospirillaceae bacterium]|nr:hypothetical protein [Rhodospirillaceae bacterium]MBT5194222.1 hypothetical protein [Rhodospirillaceae bacterium]MBT5897912.1 hypothetical protein [Rhodospirillaceae bacterium]MBT7757501.1 hypothetical protein [Rhodospirillaceae bacterium]
MGGLAHFLEDEGLATTQISLIRPQTENTKPPRALWVPFELGRPMGAPNDAAFQTKVLRAALALLESDQGPVLLADFDEDAPADTAAQDGEGWFCPISLPPLEKDITAGGGYKAAMEAEIGGLSTWYDIALRERGRTTMGLSGMTINQIADFICDFLDGEVPEKPSEDLTLAQTMKYAVEDLKAYYREAASAQPGHNTGRQMNNWFYGQTAAGKALYALWPIADKLAKERDDSFMKTFANVLLIPSSQKYRVAEQEA